MYADGQIQVEAGADPVTVSGRFGELCGRGVLGEAVVVRCALVTLRAKVRVGPELGMRFNESLEVLAASAVRRVHCRCAGVECAALGGGDRFVVDLSGLSSHP